MPPQMRVVGVSVYFLPIRMRMPLKFGREIVTEVVCCRVRMKVADERGNRADGWGETPLIAQWGWASERLSYTERLTTMQKFCLQLAKAWAEFDEAGHAFEIGHAFLSQVLPSLLSQLNAERTDSEPMPYLAALICNAPFDLALHDAYGNLVGLPTYATYRPPFLRFDLSAYLERDEEADFRGKFPADFLLADPPKKLLAWHLVGAKDPLTEDDLTGDEPDDGYPVLLRDWILRDGLKCLKVKLTGTDFDWDYARFVRVGQIASAHDVMWLTADFNCTVTDPQYVLAFLDKLLSEHPRLWQMLLYIEQPFPYDLEAHPIDVRAIATRKPLFMDESAHDWRFVRLGRKLGWTGVALKTCKTQTGALLMQAWAKAHGMLLMVQDLTNPMLALISHVLLAAHADTLMGVEVNAMQFYPEASAPEAQVHPLLYRRVDGCVDLSSVRGSGFGYRLAEMRRLLPEPTLTVGEL
jgi:L-alanine-DL-glutamate epimerase-like enolase superfamily enzyme